MKRERGKTAVGVLLWTCSLQVFTVLAQGAFAGSFLSGTDAAVRMHEAGGWTAFALALLQLVILVVARIGSAAVAYFVSSVILVIAEMLQLGTGYGKYLQVHIPLSLLIACVLIWQLIWLLRLPSADVGSDR